MISPQSENIGRGDQVLVCEQNDLASGTSSAAIGLIHGRLRCLEHRASRLVCKALMECEVLWRIALQIM